jgi:hypothetical protein
MTGSLARPEPRRIVPRIVVDALIADADREISSLELRVERAESAADATELRLAELGIDERASAWATVQLERFVTELRADADAAAVAVVEEARVRARLVVEEADTEARQLRLIATPLAPAPEPVEPVVEAAPVVDLVIAEPPSPEAADADPVFHEITPEALAADEAGNTVASLDPDFWPTEPPRRKRFVRARTVAAPTLAGLLVVAAVVLRVA